ncbi:endonuclease/exonuclease/phosphatase family protein, partial [Rhodonellum sp.]
MKITLQIISFFLIFAGLLPLIKRDYWTFRVFDYPRMQKLTLTLTIIFIWLSVFYNQLEIFDLAIVSALVILAMYLFWQIFPFTPFSKKMIKDAKGNDPLAIKVFVSNVYQYNTDFKKTTSLIEKENPDVFLLVETDQKWADAIEIFKEEYPYHIEKPLDNTYGMLFYSKLPIKKEQLLYLIDDEIPSLELDLELRDGNLIKIYAIHPTPPVPGENTTSTERDAEILIVGKKAK